MIQKHSTSKFATKLKFKINKPNKNSQFFLCVSTNTDINKLNWRFNHIFFSDHKPGLLLYVNSLAISDKYITTWYKSNKYSESINSDLQRELDRRLRHTQH